MSNTTAGEDDLRDVIQSVVVLAGRWEDLGLCLRLRIIDLHAIQSNYPHSSNECLREMLCLWLRQCYSVSATLQP